jgi:HAD superfamily phosphatase
MKHYARMCFMEKLDILVFDMDGVLIDVTNSYRKTIQRTVQIYLGTCLGFKGRREQVVTGEDISLFKSTGGFNNDWDLSAGLLYYLLSISGVPPSHRRLKFSSVGEVVSYLKTRSPNLNTNITRLIQRKKLPPFIKKVKLAGGGLKGVRKALKGSWEGWIYGDGDLDQTNVVKRIFQEVYLGKKFASYYHLPLLFNRKEGLYLQEKLIIPREIVFSLKKKLRLGIASGRPRFEAELVLKRFRLLSYFDSVVTLDECLEEEKRILRATGRRMNLSKPHPYSLLRVVKEVGLPRPGCGYIGDVVDDIRAALASRKKGPMLAIGFVNSRTKRNTLRKSLLKAGADLVIGHPRDLLRLASSSSASKKSLGGP